MSWQIGYDDRWGRDIGYGVPATCDHPGCGEEIDRGVSFLCGGSSWLGAIRGCGLHFCDHHLAWAYRDDEIAEDEDGDIPVFCERCREFYEEHGLDADPNGITPFAPTPDVLEWVEHKLVDPSWRQWRDENPAEAEHMRRRVRDEAAGRAVEQWRFEDRNHTTSRTPRPQTPARARHDESTRTR